MFPIPLAKGIDKEKLHNEYKPGPKGPGLF